MTVARYLRWLQCGVVALLVLLFAAAAAARDTSGAALPARQLPAEAREILARIERGGPYRYDRDGTVFANYERLLPARERGYYREYTVSTPGLKHRGPRRLVVGCQRGRAPGAPAHAASFSGFPHCAGPAEVYYTEDHYRSFRRVLP